MTHSIVSKVRARRLIHMVLVAVTKELSETSERKMDLFKIQDPPTTAGRVHQSSSSRDMAGSKAERKELGIGMTFQVTPSHLLPLPRFPKLLQPPKILPPLRDQALTHKLMEGISSCPWLPRVHDNLMVLNELS